MGFGNSKSASSNTTNINNTTNYGNVTGSNLSNLLGGNTIVLGDSNQMRSEASGGFGGGTLSATNSNSNTTSQSQSQKDSLDIGASVGVGGNAGSVGVSSQDNGALGGGINSAGVATASNLTPIVAIGGALAVTALALGGAKRGKGKR